MAGWEIREINGGEKNRHIAGQILPYIIYCGNIYDQFIYIYYLIYGINISTLSPQYIYIYISNIWHKYIYILPIYGGFSATCD